MPKCIAPGCETTENTKKYGKSLTLFSFPAYDESLFKQWRENSKVPEKNVAQLKLCELHFEPDCFVSPEKNALAPGAVPTVFGDYQLRNFIESSEIDKKRSLDEDGREEPPAKQMKSKETDPLKLEAEPSTETENREPTGNRLSPVIGSSLFTKQIDMGKKVYRLIIRIDKVIDPEPKPDKLQPAPTPKAPEPVVKNGGGPKPCSKTGCKLIKTTLNSKPVFQCERCSKYYVVKESKSDVSTWTCCICHEVLPSPDALSNHVRTHFTCDMCQAQCSTQMSFDKHVRLHVSTDPLLPYKCHRCPSTFEVKADVRQHYTETHLKPNTSSLQGTGAKVLFRCEYCYAVFKKEQAYKSHVSLHVKGKSGFDCALCSKSFKTAKHHADHQATHLFPAKFTCKVCGKEFSSSEDVEVHMKTHMKVQRLEVEAYKCNVCGKVFKNESTLGSHMQGHLSRAHRCPMCNKAFVNKTTLSIHLKTHSKGEEKIDASILSATNSREPADKKRHSCTLCLSAFDTRSKLYNHIMTHLEKMHAAEGDVVLDGLDELLESDEYILS